MPLPTPNNKEKKSDFVSRCISEVAKDPKFKDNKQRVAICYTQFDEAKKSKASVVGEIDGEEFLIYSDSAWKKKMKAAEESMEEEESPEHESDPKDMKEDMEEGECDCEEGETCEKCEEEMEAKKKVK
jgi:DNA-binding transcriptional regulator/RsmH inhibitor MraZ